MLLKNSSKWILCTFVHLIVDDLLNIFFFRIFFFFARFFGTAKKKKKQFIKLTEPIVVIKSFKVIQLKTNKPKNNNRNSSLTIFICVMAKQKQHIL
jgi:hypothetical protein